MNNRPLLLDDPWQVTAEGFPHAASATDKLLYGLNYAVLAPSILNSQPWRFRIGDDVLSLYISKSARFPIADPHARELTISCGAALFNLRLVLRSFGCDTQMEIVAQRAGDLIAEVSLAGRNNPTEHETRLREAILVRRTHRGAFEDRPVPQALQDSLVQAAGAEGATLHFLSDAAAKREVAELVSEAERQHLSNPSFRNELTSWLSQRRDEMRASMDEATWRMSGSGHTPEPRTGPRFSIPDGADMARRYADTEGAAGYQFASAERSPAIALVGSEADSRAAWLAVGMAMQRVLLTAAAEGVQASFLNPPIELPALRARVAKVFGLRWPQVLLRLGYAPSRPPTPRLPGSQVVYTGSNWP